MTKKILTVSELAEHLNVHRITIYRLLKNGSLPGFKIGRVWRFDLDEIGRWMDDGKSAEAVRAATDGEADGHGTADTNGQVKSSTDDDARKPSASAEQGPGLQPKR